MSFFWDKLLDMRKKCCIIVASNRSEPEGLTVLETLRIPPSLPPLFLPYQIRVIEKIHGLVLEATANIE